MIVLAALCALAVQDKEEIKISMRVGIVGGFAPPTVRLTIDISVEQDKDEVQIQMMKRGADKKEIVKTGTLSRKDLEPIWDLPKEDPEGCQDIYDLDTGVSIQRGLRSWRNGGPGGCVRMHSEVQPSADQKKAFVHIVERLTQAGEKFATQ